MKGGEACGGVPRVAGLALGKSSHRVWTSPGTHRASYSLALGMRVGGGVCRGAEGPCTRSGARSRVLSDACIVHCEGVFAAIISSEGRGPNIPGGGLRSRCCVVTPARQRRKASPLGARRKERSASPRPLRQLQHAAAVWIRILEQNSWGKQVGAGKFIQASWGSQVHAKYWHRGACMLGMRAGIRAKPVSGTRGRGSSYQASGSVCTPCRANRHLQPCCEWLGSQTRAVGRFVRNKTIEFLFAKR